MCLGRPDNNSPYLNHSYRRGLKPSEGLLLFYIDLNKAKPGLYLQKIKKMGSHVVDANKVFFNGYKIPADSLIGAENQGFKIILHGINTRWCLLTGEALGLGYAALKKVAKYTKEHVIFQRPISIN